MSLQSDTASLAIHRVSDTHDSAFADLIRIYTEAHPASERKSPARLSAMIARPAYVFLVATEHEQVVAFTITLCFASAEAALLEYMAVAAARRSQGIGQFLFKQTAEYPRIAGRFLIAEVDSDKKPTPDAEDSARRKQFYRRLGCREVEKLDYLMPRVSTATPPAMDLMVHRRDLPASITRVQLRTWLESCYVEVYDQPADDPRIAAMLKPLPDTLRLI